MGEGARLLLGGKQCDRPGLYVEPTIFADVEDTMWIAEEESFGPIMIVSRFAKDDVEGVVARANDTEFGLASGVLSNDLNKAMKVAEKIQAGTFSSILTTKLTWPHHLVESSNPDSARTLDKKH